MVKSKLSKQSTATKPDGDYRRAKIWDHEHGCWVNLTEEEIEKRWPVKRIEQKLALEAELRRERLWRR